MSHAQEVTGEIQSVASDYNCRKIRTPKKPGGDVNNCVFNYIKSFNIEMHNKNENSMRTEIGVNGSKLASSCEHEPPCHPSRTRCMQSKAWRNPAAGALFMQRTQRQGHQSEGRFQRWAGGGVPGGNEAEPPPQSASFHSPGPHILPLPREPGEGPGPAEEGWECRQGCAQHLAAPSCRMRVVPFHFCEQFQVWAPEQHSGKDLLFWVQCN